MDKIKYIGDAKQISNNFDIRKGIPIDKRYIIESLETLDDELPLNLRYPGLRFLALNTEYKNILGKTIITGAIYCFGNDLTTPIIDTIFPKINQISIDLVEEDYSLIPNKLADLDDVYYGMLVNIVPLNIVVILTEQGWKYAFGQYNVPYDTQFAIYNTIPQTFLTVGQIVKFDNGSYGIIAEDFSVVNKIQIANSLQDVKLVEGGYYLINGILYTSLNGTPYKLSTKNKLLTNLTLSAGENIITHNLVSTNILAFLRINNINNLEDDIIGFEPVKYKTIDDSNISIYSSFTSSLSADLILIVN